MSNTKKTRRSVIGSAIGALGLSTLSKPLSAAILTPSATEGPFYPLPEMQRADTDNDLVKIVGSVREAGGEVITLRGQITDEDGNPLSGYRIEIWQCDLNGKYLHTGDRQPAEFDAGFQGFGHDITGTDGSYVFRTIKPVAYPGRTPHIHVKVFDASQEVLTTQFYLNGHPANRRDRIFGRLSQSEAEAVSMSFNHTDTGEETIVNLVL